jgi:hypothetical protein
MCNAVLPLSFVNQLQRSVMPDEGLGQVAATVIVKYKFTDEGED